MVRKPPDANSFIEVDPFDVFRVEGDIDRLDSQRFEKDKIRRSKASQGIRSNRLIDDQKVDTEAQRLILDVRYAQQQALKDLYAIGVTSGLVIPREMTDSDGPEHQRIFSGSAGPENQRIISDTDGPVLPSVIRLASLREPTAKARLAQQNALKEIHAIKDMIFSSSASRKDRLTGPLEPRKFSNANGPILPPLSSSRHDPEDRKNLSLEKLLERIKKARAEQQASLKYLHVMQDADGPQKDRTMSDLDLRLVKASQSQLTAMGYLKRLEDVAGPLMAKHWSDSTRETDIKDRSDAAGPIRARNSDDATGPAMPTRLGDAAGPSDVQGVDDAIGPQTPRRADDAQGPVLAREAVDAEGPAKLREATDASGPLLPRQAIDAAGPNAPNSFDDAVGPTDRRLITDAKGPTLFHRIIEAVLPKKAVSVVKETPIEIEHHQSSIAERIAKVKADQRDAMQQLGELEKDNDKPLL
ncbi:MAG: hypothetical protein ACKO6R_08375 [Burkholderiaceae bacterium]